MRITELGLLLQILSKEDRVTFSVYFIAWLKWGIWHVPCLQWWDHVPPVWNCRQTVCMSRLHRIAISVWKTCGVPTVNLFRADLKGEFVIHFYLFVLPTGEGTTFESCCSYLCTCLNFNRTWGPIPWPQFWRLDIWFVFWGFVKYNVNKSQKSLFL